jgi:ribosomal protein S18 acetylase RimI-like enzyme
MDDDQFRTLLERSIPRRAEKWVERGIWAKEPSLEAARTQYAHRLAQGRSTPSNQFCALVDQATGERVGVVWYSARTEGGKLQFWVEWLEVDPVCRRRGYATHVLGLLENEAVARGADRIGLNVWMDNPGAIALYTKLGFSPSRMVMTKELRRST